MRICSARHTFFKSPKIGPSGSYDHHRPNGVELSQLGRLSQFFQKNAHSPGIFATFFEFFGICVLISKNSSQSSPEVVRGVPDTLPRPKRPLVALRSVPKIS